MKKILAISFLVLYVFTATELHQLLKFPKLVEHFLEHKKTNKSISLSDFLHMHYADDYTKDKDYEQDMKLPFKSHDNCASCNFVSLPVNSQEIFFSLMPVITKKVVLYKRINFQSSFLSSIWQPPKVC